MKLLKPLKSIIEKWRFRSTEALVARLHPDAYYIIFLSKNQITQAEAKKIGWPRRVIRKQPTGEVRTQLESQRRIEYYQKMMEALGPAASSPVGQQLMQEAMQTDNQIQTAKDAAIANAKTVQGLIPPVYQGYQQELVELESHTHPNIAVVLLTPGDSQYPQVYEVMTTKLREGVDGGGE